MKQTNNIFKKGLVKIPKEKLLEYSKMPLSARLKWLEEANEFVKSIVFRY
ncbi:MAG: hypothetical protein WC527_00035 [Candidatus Margulisiibacteriota bacterium]